MRTKPRIFAPLLIIFTSIAVAFGQGSLQSMRLLTPQDGWAASLHQLFWTTDAGLHWSDITPAMASPSQKFASVFFLDSSRGWVLRVDHEPTTGEPQFDLASTASAGASWSITRLDVPDIDPSRGLSSQAWIDFVDASHGWVMARMNGNTAVSFGVLLATEDGGATWKSPAVGPPVAGPIRFVTAKQGWLAGGPYDALYRTNDGGETWQPVTLPAPPLMHSSAQASYELPNFEDSSHGSLTIDFSGPDDETPMLAMFTTVDGGRTWKPGATMPKEPSALVTTFAGSHWIAAAISDRKLCLKTVSPGGKISGLDAPGHSLDKSLALELRQPIRGMGLGKRQAIVDPRRRKQLDRHHPAKHPRSRTFHTRCDRAAVSGLVSRISAARGCGAQRGIRTLGIQYELSYADEQGRGSGHAKLVEREPVLGDNDGQIAGTQEPPYIGVLSPFLYQSGTFGFFDPDAMASLAYGINDNAQIVGYNGDSGCNCGFVAVP